jgi:Amt family ammonium transporter
VNQIIASGIACGLGIVGTLVILKIVDVVTGVRTTDAEETEGLDLSMHGEEGYHLEG